MAAPARERAWLWRHVVPLLLYTLLALLLTWPLAVNLLTHVPGDGIDDPALAWNLWWANERLVQQANVDLFHVGWMFHPISINLAFYTLTPLPALASLPLQGRLELTLVNNLLVLATLVISAYGMYQLAVAALAPARRADESRRSLLLAAFIAGAFYAFAAPRLFYLALGQFNIAAALWIPFCALYTLRLVDARTAPAALHAGAMAALFLLLQAWTEMTYASFLLLFVAAAGAAGFPAAVRSGRGQGFVAGFAVLAAVLTIGLAPMLAAMLPDLRAEGDFFASGGGFAQEFSADLAGFLVPTPLHPLLGNWSAALPFANDKGQQLWLGYTALLLAVAGFGRLRRRRRGHALFWAVAALLFWLLSLGPSLHWMGRDLGIPGPFQLVSRLPFFSGNRYPSRYGVMLLLCLGVLMAAGLVALFRRLEDRHARAPLWAGLFVGALLLFEHASVPLPLSDFRIPPIYRSLAAQPGDLAVLELPTGWRNGARVLGYSDLLIMRQQWWQTAHGKRRLGGNTSRNPPHKFQYFTEHPLLGDLIALMNADRPHIQAEIALRLPAMIARHAPMAGRELADLGVGFVTVHVEHASPALLAFINAALPLGLLEEWQGRDPEGAPATIRLYRVENQPQVDASTVRRSANAAATEAGGLLAQGWSPLSSGPIRYANQPAAHLLLPLPADGGALTLETLAAPSRLLLNGRALPFTWTDGLLHARFAAGAAGQPVDRIVVEWEAQGEPVTALVAAPAPIGATGATFAAGATLVVRSAGEEVGDFAEIWLNGENIAKDLPQRGYLLVAVEPSGRLLAAEAFDTHGEPAASAHLAAWVAQWPAGTLVAGAVADEASLTLGADAVQALASLGVQGDLRGRFRWSHAFVGVAGSPPATALESADLIRPAGVWLGAPVTGARVYGALGAIEWRGALPVAAAE